MTDAQISDPPVIQIAREAAADTTLHLRSPVVTADGRTLTEVVVPAGTQVFCGIQAYNTDSSLWGADAREWKPERWMESGGLPSAAKDIGAGGVYSHT